MNLTIAIFEGADFDILSDFMQQGLLPNFKKLGNIFRATCSCIPYEAAGLMSAFSGIPENVHGISSYWKAQNYSYIPELWRSEQVKDKMIWNQSCMDKYNKTIINLWGTHPVYPINGSIVSYSMEKSLRYTYPSDLSKNLVKKNINCVQDTCTLFNKGMSPNEFGDNVRRIDKMRHKAFVELSDNSNLSIINYTSIDRVSHFFFDEFLSEGINSQIHLAYKQCDEILGQLLLIAEHNKSDLIVFSEIGFGKLKRFVNINDELLKGGLLAYSNKTINWEKTVAFESVQGSHGININKKNVFKNGIIDDRQYEKTLNETICFLKTLKNKDTGMPLFKRVVKNIEYYINYTNAPDIILEPFDQEYLPYGDPHWSDFLTRNSQTGWHRSNGIYSAYTKQNVPMRDIQVDEIYKIVKQHI